MTKTIDKNQITFNFFYLFQFLFVFCFFLTLLKFDQKNQLFFLKIVLFSFFTFIIFVSFNDTKRCIITTFNIIILFLTLWANKIETEDNYSIGEINNKILFKFSEKFNIIYTETNIQRTKLTARQMCSIESAALHNPEANILLFSLKAKLNDTSLLKKYKNIKFILTNPEQVYQGTPLEEWWKKQKKKLESSMYKINDLSDTFRLALVYKYGGLYSDLDILNLKNLESLRFLNGVCKEDDSSANNAILLFEKNHKFLLAAMNNLIKNFKINIWGYNGPNLMSRVFKEYCKSKDIYNELVFDTNQEYNISNLNQLYKKCDMVLFHKNFFYPFHWTQTKSLFEKNALFPIKDFKSSYGIHFYNKISKDLKLKLNDNSIYEYFISQNCPLTYNYLLRRKINEF